MWVFFLLTRSVHIQMVYFNVKSKFMYAFYGWIPFAFKMLLLWKNRANYFWGFLWKYKILLFFNSLNLFLFEFCFNNSIFLKLNWMNLKNSCQQIGKFSTQLFVTVPPTQTVVHYRPLVYRIHSNVKTKYLRRTNICNIFMMCFCFFISYA